MPLCPQITNTPVTVALTGDFTVTSVLPTGKNKTFYQTTAPTGGMLEGDLWVDTDDKNKMYRYTSGAWVSVQDGAISDAAAAAAAAEATANAAAAAAGAAQTAAAAALAEATDAYNAAIGSLQPSASTIVNASNQMTAINSSGITVYSGSSATSGPRVVMNSLGLAAYTRVNVSNAVGNGSTVTYTAGGHSFGVGTTVTITELAPSGYNGTFVITAVVAGSTFTVSNSTTATLTDSNGFAEASTLAISASTGNAVFAGSITGSTIIGGTLNIAGKATINSAGLLTATDATITGDIRATAGYFGTASNGFSINSTGMVGVGSGTIIGGTITTSSGNQAVTLNGSANAVQFKSGGSIVANMLPLLVGGSTYGLLMHYGATPNASGGTFPQMFIGSANVSMFANSTTGIGISTSLGVSVAGTFSTDGAATFGATNSFQYLSGGTLRSLFTYSRQVTASTRALLIDSSGNIGNSTSTRRNKHEIESYKIDSEALLKLDVKTFKYNLELSPEQSVQYGFIAEEAQELGLDELIQYDETGIPSYFSYEKLPIFLLQIVQELKAEIKQLKGE